MDAIHIRLHEMGKKPRIRVWTDEMAGYGQFAVIEHNDGIAVVASMKLIGVPVIGHYCDGMDECKCRPIAALDEML